MNNFMLCLNSVIPSFLAMIAGFVSVRAGVISRAMVPKFNSVIFKVFFPCLVFYNIYNSDLAHAIRLTFILFIVAGILLETAAALLIARFTTAERSRRGVMTQGMMRANTLVVGLPIAMELLGDVDLGPVIISLAVAVPIFNVVSVIVLETYNGEQVKPGKLVVSILKNPLIIGTVAAILCLLLKVTLPSAILSTVKSMGQASSPIMLFLVGAFFSFDKIGSAKKELIISSSCRLLIFPALILFTGYAMGLRDAEFVGLITIFASSTAVASFSMAQQLGGDAELAGNIVVVTSAICPLTIFLFSFLFKTLGAF